MVTRTVERRITITTPIPLGLGVPPVLNWGVARAIAYVRVLTSTHESSLTAKK